MQQQTIMYAVERITYYRKRNKNGSFITTGTSMEQYYYTSKNKAVDRARSLAETIKPYNVELSYNLYKRGVNKTYTDYTIKIAEFHESEGKLQFEDMYYYLDTDQGNILPRTRMKEVVFFDSI